MVAVSIRIALVILCAVPPLLARQPCVQPQRRGRNIFLEHVQNVDGLAHQHRARSASQVDRCGSCPARGCCVPRVQCPALLRAPHDALVCHIGGHVGVCCTTGQSHSNMSNGERESSSLSAEALRSVHRGSEARLSRWVHAEQLVAGGAANGTTVLSRSSPAYAHFLSIRTGAAEKERLLGRGALRNLFATQELHQRQDITEEQLRLGLPLTNDSPFCPPAHECPPTPERYRRVGGECNNAANAGWGAARTAYERILPPNYSDGTWSFRTSVSGLPLVSARAVSEALLLRADNPSGTYNLMLSQFGQFITHDVSAGATFTLANGSAISCCTPDGASFLPPQLQHQSCAAISVDPSDDFFSQFQVTCMNFVRTQLAPSHDCSLGFAKQMNGVNHFPDLSPIYGSSEAKLAELREQESGRMRTFLDFGRELPPISANPDECLMQQDGAGCFASGDGHVNQMISLVSLNTLWIREHNRLADTLSQLNPAWTPDVVFLEARRILIAEYQHIIYNEWLPLVIGSQTMEAFGLTPRPGGHYSDDYSADINPSLTSEFAAAAMRFGHSTVDNKLMVQAPERMYEEISIPEVMFQPSRMRLREFHDRLLAGLAAQPMQTVDPFLSEALTRYMFHGGQPFGLDLGAINIQRGRDHGLRAYNDYLRLTGSKPIADFSQFPPKTAERLSSVYASPEDMDLWVGGLLEPPLEGAVVGNTFSNILGDQFSRLRRGDRYFYEHGPDVNPGAFTKDQLAEIKMASLSRLVCDHSDRIELHSHAPHGFLRPQQARNEPVPCDSPLIPSMDLSKFKEI